jgi:hypothetical protein
VVLPVGLLDVVDEGISGNHAITPCASIGPLRPGDELVAGKPNPQHGAGGKIETDDALAGLAKRRFDGAGDGRLRQGGGRLTQWSTASFTLRLISFY